MSVDVYHLMPINRTAALVTSQSGCASDDTLTPEQIRENLVAAKKLASGKAMLLPKKHPERKRLNQEILELNNRIHEIRARKKAKGVESFFIDVCRYEMSKAQFGRIMDKAVALMEAKKAEILADKEVANEHPRAH